MFFGQKSGCQEVWVRGFSDFRLLWRMPKLMLPLPVNTVTQRKRSFQDGGRRFGTILAKIHRNFTLLR